MAERGGLTTAISSKKKKIPTLTFEEKILLILSKYDYCRDDYQAPAFVSQAGLARVLGVALNNVPRLIKKMVEKGHIKEKLRHVEGGRRRLKVYFLEGPGSAEARKLADFVNEIPISLRDTNGNSHQVKLNEVSSHLDRRIHPFDIYNHLTEDGLFDVAALYEVKKSEPEIEIPPLFSLRMPIDAETQFFWSDFVGRKEELDTLKECLGQATKGKGQFVLIAGEAGIGKTRLVSELYFDTKSKGVRFLVGRCLYEKEIDPYLPFKEAINQYFRGLNGSEIGTMEFGESTGALLQNILSPMSVEGKSPKNEVYMDKDSMFESYAQLFTSIAGKSPLVLFLDDLQWADTASLHLLHYIARNAKEAQILIIGAYRPEALEFTEGAHPLTDMIRRMTREKLVAIISLNRLSMEESTKLTSSILESSEYPEGFFETLYEETEGNPFFIEEILKSLVEEGVFNIHEKHWQLPFEKSKMKIPSGIKTVILERIDRLDENSLKTLTYASVIGHEFEFDLLQAVIGLDDETLGDSLDRLINCQLINEKLASNEIRFGFDHHMIREVTYNNPSRTRILQIHANVGLAVEKLNEGFLDDVISDLVYHFSNAMDHEKTLFYSIKAGRKAKSIHAPREATRYLEMALHALQFVKKKKEYKRLKTELLMELSALYDALGNWDLAVNNYERAIELCNTTNDDVNKADSYIRTGNIMCRRNEWDLALKNFEKGLAIAEEVSHMRGVAGAHMGLGDVFWRKGEYDEAKGHYEVSLKIATDANDVSGEANAYRSIGVVYKDKGEWDDAVKYYDKCVKLTEKTNNKYQLARAYNSMGVCHFEKGDLDKALEYYEKFIDISKSIEYLRGLAYGYHNAGEIYAKKGELGKAIEYNDKALTLFQKLNERSGIAGAYSLFGIIYGRRKEWIEAIDFFEKGIKLAEELGILYLVGSINYDCGRMYKDKGDKAQTLKHLYRAKEIFEKISNKKMVESTKKELDEL